MSEIMEIGGRWMIALVLASLVAFCASAAEPFNEKPPLPVGETRPPVTPEQVRGAIRRGVDFLLASQNEDGSWGGPQPIAGGYQVSCSVPGGHQAMQVGSSALAFMGLLECETFAADPALFQRARDKGLDYLLAKGEVRRGGELYSCWSHAYVLRALVAAFRHPSFSDRKEAIRAKGERMICAAAEDQTLAGGWGYYVDTMKVRPVGDAMSFATATMLESLYQAKQLGWRIPDPAMVARGVECLRRMRRPDGAYVYGLRHAAHPIAAPNSHPGAISRIQPCNLALYHHGCDVTREDLSKGVGLLFSRLHGYLENGWRTPKPHSAWYMISAYYYYYCHYYAALQLEYLPADQAREISEKLSAILLPEQGCDGSWWDTVICFNYAKFWGTGCALISLKRALEHF